MDHLLNVVALTKGEDIYITDTEYGAVYMVRKETDKLELFLGAEEFHFKRLRKLMVLT